MSPSPAAEVRARLARAHGHLHAVIDMMDAERSPVEILQQLRAVRAALDRATGVLLDDMLHDCQDASPRQLKVQLETVRAAIKTLA